jgi:four helix bundle protein
MGIKTFRDLTIWQKSIELVIEIYSVTKEFPKEETYGLVSQMRRAAVSIPSNVAEGFRRFHNKEYKQFLYISSGSCGELETQVTIAKKLGYIDDKQESALLERMDHIGRMTSSLIKKL